MKQRNIPHIGMRIIKTAVAVMLAYGIFLPFGLMYDTETYHGVLGQMGPLYACIACIVCMQSTLGQTVQSGVSRLIGVAIGGVLGVATLLLGDRLDNGLLVLPILGVLCVAGIVLLEFSLDGRLSWGEPSMGRDYALMSVLCAAMFAVPASLLRKVCGGSCARRVSGRVRV